MNTSLNNKSTLIVYPEYDKRIERDYLYEVTVTQGENSFSLPCYNHCDSVSTSSRTFNGDMYRRFCEFAFEGEVRVDFTAYCDFDSYTVMPSAKGFKSSREGNVISVYLDKPDYFLIKLDASDDSILAVFADAPETDVPEKGDKDVIYIDGWYEPEDGSTLLTVAENNKTLYLAPGSVLNARVRLIGDNITVKGRGMILDPYSDIYRTDVSETDKNDMKREINGFNYLLLVTGTNCSIDGIKMVDSRAFNLWVQCEGLKVTNLKIISSEMCTDGITPHLKGGNSYKHCFIYVADNGIVLNRSEQISYFEDITIGTICCGIFPQNNSGIYEMKDIYIFRCDEGLMRNCYNWASQPRSFELTINNISAVDCDHFPFIFYGYGMGHAPKAVTFNNIAVPNSTGSKDLGYGDGTEIFVTDQKIDTGNYTLTFNGLTVGGKVITDAAELKQNITDDNTIVVTGKGSNFGPALPATNVGAVKVDGLIYIGARRLDTKLKAVKKDSEWLVPAEDVCRALFKALPASVSDVNGENYISLAALVESGVAKSAEYNAATGRITVEPTDEETGDLYGMLGNEAHSHWSEFFCWKVHVVWLPQYSGNSFRLESCENGAGLTRNLTPQFQQYGRGKYILTFEAKADTDTKLRVFLRANKVDLLDEYIDLTGEWAKFEFTVDNDIDGADIKNAFSHFVATESATGNEIRNARLVFNK